MYGRKMRLAMLEDYELWYCAGMSCQKSSWNTVLGNCQWTKWLQDSYGHLPGLYRTYAQSWEFRSQLWGNADHNESQDKLCFGSLVQESLDVDNIWEGAGYQFIDSLPLFLFSGFNWAEDSGRLIFPESILDGLRVLLLAQIWNQDANACCHPFH